MKIYIGNIVRLLVIHNWYVCCITVCYIEHLLSPDIKFCFTITMGVLSRYGLDIKKQNGSDQIWS